MRRMGKRSGPAVIRFLTKEANIIITISKRNHVPVDLGTLRSSGFVHSVKRKGPAYEVTMGFGGAAAAYAMAIHEVHSEYDPPTWKGVDVKFKPSGRGRKYLEKPLRERSGDMNDRLATYMRDQILKMEGVTG